MMKFFEASVCFLYSFTVNKHVVFSSIKQRTILHPMLLGGKPNQRLGEEAISLHVPFSGETLPCFSDEIVFFLDAPA